MKTLRGFGSCHLLVLLVALGVGASASAQSFTDDFASDSTGTYTLTLLDPSRGTATFVHDAAGGRAQILSGDNFGLRVAHSVPARTSGRFTVDLRPTVKYPSGGSLTLRLIQDSNNYYVVHHTSANYAPGSVSKVVGGVAVETASFASNYVQNADYNLRVDFAPGNTGVQAFGQSFALVQDATPIAITRFEIEAYQQDVYVDTILYGDEAVTNLPPVADAGPDQSAAAGDLVTLDARGSSDEGPIAAYAWQQTSGPAVTLSNPASATPSFIAPDPGSGSTTLAFQLTVFDAFGTADTDTVFVDSWSPSALVFSDDFSSNTVGNYQLTLLDPDRGTATFVYDAAGQRAQIRSGDNFGLRVARDVPPRTSGHFAVNLLPTQKYPGTARLAVRLVQDASNYIELTNYNNSTPDTFTKVIGGVAVETRTFAGSYAQGTPYPVSIDFGSDQSVAEAFGALLALDQDTAPLTVRRIEIESYQQDTYIDDLDWSAFQPHPASIELTEPVAGQFESSSTLHAAATTVLLQPGWRLVFAVDAGTPDEIAVEDATEPFAVDLPGVAPGIHSVDVYVVDENGAQVLGAGLHDQVSNVAVGDYYVGFGDSITKGTGDNVTTDNVSLDGRNAGGGYEPILNDILSAALEYPHTVKNEGVGGKTSGYGASNIAGVLGKHPEAQFVIALFGTNDSLDAIRTPSGAGLDPGDPGYAGSYKANMQAVVSAVLAAGKEPVLVKVPFTYGDCSRCTPYPDPANDPRNVLIREYNQALDELIAQNALSQAPDLYSHFEQHPEQMRDRHHPNGIGYQSIAAFLADLLIGR